MACSCRLDSSIRARTRRTASSGTTPASGIGSPGSGGAPSWSRRPSAWWTSASPCSPASLAIIGSAISYLCSPKTLNGGVGNDRMSGGWGNDEFFFERYSGRDTITDFGHTVDANGHNMDQIVVNGDYLGATQALFGTGTELSFDYDHNGTPDG